ncbi:GGDEF domain-containing protein [Candidatus Woesearchaeota archaeon]|nr:GGDEF domain-containing protein [Candidatus Woesearchaeota archaeon]
MGVTELFVEVDRLSQEEKRALNGFEKRLQSLDDHRKLVKSIIKELYNDTSKAKPLLKKLIETLQEAFRSLRPPEDIHLTLTHEEELLKDQIQRIRSLRMVDESQVTDRLQKMLMLESEEENLVQAFARRVNDFRSLVNKQRSMIEKELQILDNAYKTLEKGGYINREEIVYELNRLQEEISRLIRAEKDALHDPLDVIVERNSQAKRFVQSLWNRDANRRFAARLIHRNKITPDDIKKDVRTFTRPDEFSEYRFLLSKEPVASLVTAEAADLLQRLEYKRIQKERDGGFLQGLLKEMAFKDRLTQISNRRFLDSEGKKLFSLLRERRIGSLGIFMMDIDYFKKFNDTYGHQVGDMVLAEVGSVLRSSVRKSDIKGRYGGEEFTVIVVDVPKSRYGAIADLINRRIIEQSRPVMAKVNLQYIKKRYTDTAEENSLIRSMIDNGTLRPYITMSIGIHDVGADESYEQALKRADSALYSAKEAGRNRYHII